MHGDPAGSNVLITDQGSLVLIDPPGAIRGPREADAGQIASHVGCGHDGDPADKAAEVIALVEEAAAADRSLDPRLVALFAARTCSCGRGYFLARHEHAATAGAVGREPVLAAEAYMAAARQPGAAFSAVISRYTVMTPLGPVQLASDERLVHIQPCPLAWPARCEDPLSVLLRMASVRLRGELGNNGPLIASLANPENSANPEFRRYEAVFGRDALYSAAFLADLYPQLEAGTVRFLAGFQARKSDPLALAAPGKIPNHIRDPDDPLARKLTAETGRRWPWFGGTDTTVLFLSAACRVIDRDADALNWQIRQGRRLRDAMAAAGQWLLGELRQDLLWAYLNLKDSYTVWTDSPNAFHHADGTLASPPVAPVQLQAEAHDALCGLARHATALGLPGRQAGRMRTADPGMPADGVCRRSSAWPIPRGGPVEPA